jgi:dihydrofolate synthase/folylpolyglutamate synthase
MNFAEAVHHLYALGPELRPPHAEDPGHQPSVPPRRFDLAHMRALCAALGDPHTRFRSVLIAGTNGKGSTAATLAAIVNAAGYRTALYTSPHLSRVNERIQTSCDGVLSPIPDATFADLYTRVHAAGDTLVASGVLPCAPSFFERLTAVAFLFFAHSGIDLAVLEVGLGGRLDATNIVDPLLSVITDIALDHQEFLGDTITLIAREKCGILRPGGTLVTLPQHPEANQAIGEIAVALEVKGISASPFLPPARRNAEGPSSGIPRNRYTLPLEDPSESGHLQVDSPLSGQHQQRNIALALAAAFELRNQHGYNLSKQAMEAGLRATVWPGRLEFIAPGILLDVAHNPAGAWTLRAAISALDPDQPRTLIFSCLKDKNLSEISRILFPLFDSTPGGDPQRRRDHLILAPINNPRAASLADLQSAAQQLGTPASTAASVADALLQARALTPPGGLIVVTGSVYLVGEAREVVIREAVLQETIPA